MLYIRGHAVPRGFLPAAGQEQSVTTRLSSEDARQRAELRQEKTRLRDHQVAESARYQQEQSNASAAKVLRLRELRLAREAEQRRLADERAAAQLAQPPKRSHKAKAKTAEPAGETAEA